MAPAHSSIREDFETALFQVIDKQKACQSQLSENAVKLRLIAEEFEKYNLTDDVMELEDSTLQAIRFNQIIQTFTASVETVMANYTYSETGSDFGQLITEEMKRRDSASDFDPENHELYTSFKEAVWNVHHSGVPMPGHEDDEIIMTTKFSAKSNLHCPLTMKSIVDLKEPVCCSECRHVYEKESVLAYIASQRRNTRCKCPIPGCPKFVTKENLVFDGKLKLELLELKSKIQETNSENQVTALE